MTPKGNVSFQLGELFDQNNNAMPLAPGSGHIVNFTIPQLAQLDVTDDDRELVLKALLIRNLPQSPEQSPEENTASS